MNLPNIHRNKRQEGGEVGGTLEPDLILYRLIWGDCRGKARLGLGGWWKAVRVRQDADGRDWSKKSRNGFSVPWMEEEGGSASSFNSFCPVRSDPAWADKRLRSLHVQCFFTCQSNCYKTTPCSGMDRGSKPVVPNRIISAAGYTQKRSQATDILQKKALDSESVLSLHLCRS
eukprot:XP_017446731.1 PREDICTED: uncharacterized protein LOC103691527 isoform X2 [Rattus norvegicus]